MGSKRKLLESKDCVDGLYISEVWTKSMLTKGYTQNKKRAAEQLIYYSRPRTYGDEDKQTAAQVLTSPRSTYIKFNNNYLIISTMKTNQLTPNEIRFILAVDATWTVLRQPVLTKIYHDQWASLYPRPLSAEGEELTLYGYVFNVMYKEV